MREQKVITAYYWLFVCVAFLSSCTKDKTVPPSQTFVCNNQIAIAYSANVSPIVNQYCAIPACHSGVNSSGIYLTNYTNTKESFQLGNALCTIKHEVGCKAMPYPLGSNKLSDSLISVIDCWAQKGFPN